MDRLKTRKIVINGIMIALVFLVTKFAGFTMPFGYFNLGDAVIMTTAILLGKRGGFVAGALGASLSDVLTPGFVIFAPITFVVKGLEGYAVGAIAGMNAGKGILPRITAVLVGSAIMIAGYFLGEVFILGAIDESYGLTYAVNELVSTNLLQGAFCSMTGYLLSSLLLNANIHKYIKN